MGHPAIENATPFWVEPLFLADEEGRSLLVPLVKATYEVTAKGTVLASEQIPVKPEGEPWGEPGKSSFRYEAEGTLPKPATDVGLVGSAVAPRGGTTEMLVTLQVGPLKKAVRLLGDRTFFKTVGGVGLTKPATFERIPLVWERAFGGWDRSNPTPAKHAYEARNPVGTGFRAPQTQFEEGLLAPNLEDPVRPFKGWGDRPTPTGFGFTSHDWEPRRSYAGTYDQRWEQDRAPLLPKDFDHRFFNAAAPGLVAAGYLRGDEQVLAAGVTAAGGISFKLPGVAPPSVKVEHRGRPDATVGMNLDTVIIDSDAGRLLLFWRGKVSVREPTSVRSIRVVAGTGATMKGATPAA